MLPGADLFQTIPPSFLDFSNNSIPADFFGPGSEPFNGIINLKGSPTDPLNFEDTGTIVQRLDTANLPEIPSSDTIPIEIISLSLVSVEPITVRYNYYNNSNLELWDVQIILSPFLNSEGRMTITKEHADGGTFNSEFLVQPIFIFTKIDDRTEKILEDVRPFQLQTSNVPWNYECPSLLRIDGFTSNFCAGFSDEAEIIPAIGLGAELYITPTPAKEEEPEILCCFGDGPNDNCDYLTITQCREQGGAVMDCGLPEEEVEIPTIEDCNNQRKQAFEDCKEFKGINRAACMLQAASQSKDCKEDVPVTELRNIAPVRFNASDSSLVNLTRDVVSTGVNNSAYVNGTYDCRNFAEDLRTNLTALSYNATWTAYWCYGGAGNPPATAHAVTDVHLNDGRTVFVEPQTNQIVNLDFDGDGVVEVNYNGYVPGQNNGQTDDNCKISVFPNRAAAAAAGVPGA